jgi:hypothetical protein
MSATPSPTAIWQTATAATTERKPRSVAARSTHVYLRGEKNASEPCAKLWRDNCAELRAAHRKGPPSASLRLPVRESVLTSSDALASSVELPASHSRTSCSAGTTAASSRALGASE